MKKETPLVDKNYLLVKIGGDKGGWTFAEIPEVPRPKTSFGMLKVKGSIDNYEFSNAHLMPLGNGNVGLPVKAEIRKKIKKQAGDVVHVTLYEDKAELIVPEDILLCMEYEDGVRERFESYSTSEKKRLIDWINSAGTEEKKIDRIAKTITMVQRGEKISNKLKP